MENLLEFNLRELTKYIAPYGHKPYRAKQLLKWIYKVGQKDFNLMTDLSKSFRQELSEIAQIQTPKIHLDHLSSDGTRKWLLDVGAKNGIEAVFIPEKDRGTLCILSLIHI